VGLLEELDAIQTELGSKIPITRISGSKQGVESGARHEANTYLKSWGTLRVKIADAPGSAAAASAAAGCNLKRQVVAIHETNIILVGDAVSHHDLHQSGWRSSSCPVTLQHSSTIASDTFP
jgi:hypothetical protein